MPLTLQTTAAGASRQRVALLKQCATDMCQMYMDQSCYLPAPAPLDMIKAYSFWLDFICTFLKEMLHRAKPVL